MFERRPRFGIALILLMVKAALLGTPSASSAAGPKSELTFARPYALAGFSTVAGQPSSKKAFWLDGSGNLTVTAPSGFEVSKDGTNYFRSIQLKLPKFFGNSASGGLALLSGEGALTIWNDPHWGVNSSEVSSQLTSGVKTVVEDLNQGIVGAVKDDGTFVKWGFFDEKDLPRILGKNIKKIVATESNPATYAALTEDGSVVAWTFTNFGPRLFKMSDQLTSQVKDIYSNKISFIVLKNDDSLVFGKSLGMGASVFMGDIEILSGTQQQIDSSVRKIHPIGYHFVISKKDGSTLLIGPKKPHLSFSNFPPLPSNLTGVEEIVKNNTHNNYGIWIINGGEPISFAALKSDKSVVTWGNSTYGGDSSKVSVQLSSNVKKVFSNGAAFAALKFDGSVVTWGAAVGGGNATVVKIADGNVTVEMDSVAGKLKSGVVDIFPNYQSFAALKSDGSVVTWGNAASGGDSSTVESDLYNVQEIYYSGKLTSRTQAALA